MSNVLQFRNSTIVTGTTSSQYFLELEVNKKKVGMPLFTFTASVPSMDIIELERTDIDVKNVTLVTSATSYGAALATTVNTSGYGLPLYKIAQSNRAAPINVTNPTIVSQLSSTGRYVTLKVNNVGYGIPLMMYSTVFPFTSTVAMDSIKIDTAMYTPTKDERISINEPGGSTNLNSKIKTYGNLISRIKYQLGAPFVNLEVCEDSQIVDFIDKAIEWYTKYAGFTEEYLVFHSDLYSEPGLRIDKLFSITPALAETLFDGASACWDYDLADYRKVINIFGFEQGESTGINTLFTLEQAMAQQTYFSYMLGNVGFDLVTWEVMKGWLDLRKKVLAQVPYIDFDNRNQLLRIIPAPNRGQRYYGCVGAWVEKPIRDLIMERWIEHYALAITKIAIGNIRGKYQNIQMFGGGVINYNDLLSQGLEEKKALEEELMNGYGEVTPARFFLG